MGKMSFPQDRGEKLINKYDGSLTIRYEIEGRTVEDHYKGGNGTPLVDRTIYTGETLDGANRETIFFKGSAGNEEPYLRRVYRNNRLELEQGLRGSLDKLEYQEEYIYDDDAIMPSTSIYEKFDENGKSISKLQSTLKKASRKQADPNNPFIVNLKDFDWR